MASNRRWLRALLVLAFFTAEVAGIWTLVDMLHWGPFAEMTPARWSHHLHKSLPVFGLFCLSSVIVVAIHLMTSNTSSDIAERNDVDPQDCT